MRVSLWPGSSARSGRMRSRQQSRVRLFEIGLEVSQTRLLSGLRNRSSPGSRVGAAQPEQWSAASASCGFLRPQGGRRGGAAAHRRAPDPSRPRRPRTRHCIPGRARAYSASGREAGLARRASSAHRPGAGIAGNDLCFRAAARRLRRPARAGFPARFALSGGAPGPGDDRRQRPSRRSGCSARLVPRRHPGSGTSACSTSIAARRVESGRKAWP